MRLDPGNEIAAALASAKASDQNAEVWRQRAIEHGWQPDTLYPGWWLPATATQTQRDAAGLVRP